MDPSEDYEALIELLRERGHSEQEIQKILAKLRLHDDRTLHDSVMDSIGSGRLNLDELIQQALED